MKKNGFTLIELLAVIIMLAFILLIAVPIILGIINDVKKSSAETSFKNYIRAVELAVASLELENKQIAEGTYDILENGNICLEYQDNKCINELEVKFEGEAPTGGTITIGTGKVTAGEDVIIGEYKITYENGVIKDMDKISSQEEVESIKVTLVTGQSFNSKIKTLANNGETVAYTTEDTKVTSIEFYSNGKLPKGYSKTKLNNLSKVDVSKDNDGSIMAYYEDGKVYIVSHNLISFDSKSNDMFYGFKSATSIVFTNGKYNMVDTSGVTTMYAMFRNCSGLTSLDVSKFDTTKVTIMWSMFQGCSNLTSLDVSKFNTSQVTTMQSMFEKCSGLTSLDLRNFNTSQVTTMQSMFSGAKKLKPIYIGVNWVIGESTNITDIFGGNAKTQNVDQLCEPGSTEEWCVLQS